MKMVRTIFIIVMILILFGCKAKSPNNKNEEVTLDITAFSFTHTGSSTDECFAYSMEKQGDKTRLCTEELYYGGFVLDVIIDENIAEKLNEIAEKYRIDKWDGFNKSNSLVSDGSNFSLSVTFADGTTISAHGNNSFPEGYSDAKQEICILFEELIEKYK